MARFSLLRLRLRGPVGRSLSGRIVSNSGIMGRSSRERQPRALAIRAAHGMAPAASRPRLPVRLVVLRVVPASLVPVQPVIFLSRRAIAPDSSVARRVVRRLVRQPASAFRPERAEPADPAAIPASLLTFPVSAARAIAASRLLSLVPHPHLLPALAPHRHPLLRQHPAQLLHQLLRLGPAARQVVWV